ncbi:hypothetical protein VCHA54P499_180006 [Vibrio chagasii]|nr:hypothetical protein VCHA54P499_180006 [Vibrio chagasii]CAH7137738.1 hypothetical protein VCHA53O466_210007 [Vibrio chagasii]
MALHALLNPYNVQQLYLSRFISMSIQWFPGPFNQLPVTFNKNHKTTINQKLK